MTKMLLEENSNSEWYGAYVSLYTYCVNYKKIVFATCFMWEQSVFQNLFSYLKIF